MVIDNAKKSEKKMMLTSLVTLILGIILAIDPEGSLKMLTAVIGILFMIAGGFSVFNFFRKDKADRFSNSSLVVGILMLSGGLYLALNTESLVSFITIVIGISLFIKSLFKIQFALIDKKFSDKWKYNLIVGLLTMTLAILLISNPFGSTATFLRIIGIVLVAVSVVEIISTYSVYKSLKDYKELSYVEKK